MSELQKCDEGREYGALKNGWTEARLPMCLNGVRKSTSEQEVKEEEWKGREQEKHEK